MKELIMLQAAIKTSPLLLLDVDGDGKILNYSKEAPSIFSISRDVFICHRIRDLFPSKVTVEFEKALQSIKQGKPSATFNYSLILEEEEHWFEAQFVPTAGSHYIIIIQDITKSRKNEMQVQKQLEQISALRAIDQSIASSADLEQTLSILLEQLIIQLQVDAASILLWDPKAQALRFAAGVGFRTDALKHTSLKLGQGYAGVAAQERQVVHIDNLANRKTDFLRSPLFFQENFISYFGVPLIAREKVHGVLEIFKRSQIYPEVEWLAFLEMLGGQAAIAIDNAILVKTLQQSNIDLTQAYNATIDGWSHALDIRDHETEGHTQRVTELTVRLARLIGIEEHALLHIRRGAILHDIGKMGIPDQILLKPGPLTEDEWDIMRRHPLYARDLLAPIEYLVPAMDIPLCHHERWNGSGYPSGLKAKEIPLSARIFTVVDVYDALISDRPYRRAWPKHKALNYIEDEAGRLFDPDIVTIFLKMMRGNVRAEHTPKLLNG